MKATWEKIENNVGVLEVEVNADRVTEALDQAFKKVSKRANVPGFRKGRVPRPIFEAKYGVESLYQEAIDIMLPQAYTQAVKETEIKPVDQPEIEVEQIGKGQTFKFKAKVTVKPEVKLGDYKGLEVEKQEVEVTDEELSAELTRMQERHAELVIVDEDTAATGDSVVIDFEGFVEGEAFEGGKAERYTLELGSNSFIPGFEEQLVGLGTGDFKDVEVTFPEHYHAENLAGKPAVFKVKVHEIKRKQLPKLDDEFAKDVSEFETLDEYKADLQKQLQERKEREAESAREAAVVEKAAQNAEVEIPHAMIESEIQHMVKDLDNRLRMQGMNIDMFLTLSGQTIADLREQMQKEANTRVKNNLVLEQIAKEENVSISDEELQEELEKMAQAYQRSAEEIRTILENNGTIDNLREEAAIRKTIKFLVDNSKN
ncbi:trigger factor [Paenibacillus apiarius]|uniref:Trigger factor n=1 Tax=Paenibacillus apiarius TaxID=46240 RepID=A0ABT4DYR8_9BACL|nr:trigger factor [Paenibacillus apiarius]MCY9516508.1 trigger factor [Paenibacillus apiarius]MCY9522499.1 trigger factor [Paenibacillus apiarius]MCY9554577.1 trigger factor [Paenibacillus apiarius]MCY9556693.1 trigger factor [Paenibacillus apiarius]MCY9686626.1 trigger factor [Paenibacillus apiarius]